jgi:hypothetical protein
MPIDSIKGSDEGFLTPTGELKQKEVRSTQQSKPSDSSSESTGNTAVGTSLTRIASQLSSSVSRATTTVQTDLDNVSQALQLTKREAGTIEKLNKSEEAGDTQKSEKLRADLDNIRKKQTELEAKVKSDNRESAPNRTVDIRVGSERLARVETKAVEFKASEGDVSTKVSRDQELERLREKQEALKQDQKELRTQKQAIGDVFERGSAEVSKAEDAAGKTVRSVGEAEKLATSTRDLILQSGSASVQAFNPQNINVEILKNLQI